MNNNKKRKVTGAKKLEFIEENARKVLKLLQEKDLLEREVLLEVLGVTAGACVGQRHKVECCENRPCCYRELFPQGGKSRMSGLWSKNVVSQEMKKLDPCLQVREADEPCGLLNMGQTCYVNGVLQILYAIEQFRIGVLRYKPDDGEKVLSELQLLFTSMQTSTGKCSDPTALVEALQICPRTQEDGQEFLKSLLERLPVQIRQLVKGSLCYDTVCYKCKSQRQGTDRQEDFLEILVHIENSTHLQEAIQALLDGDDVEVWCEQCKCFCLSRRRTRLVQLPRVLLFSLMRASFSSTGTEVKDRKYFSIPYSLTLDLPPTKQQQSFFLKGVLQHQGNKSTKGHYVAQVLHGEQWWEFNDEDVEQLNASSSRRTLQNKPSSRNATAAINSDATGNDEFKSRDAYMLVYCMKQVCQDEKQSPSHHPDERVQQPLHKKQRLEKEDDTCEEQQKQDEYDDHVIQLQERIKQQNQDRQKQEDRINGLQEYVNSRRSECRDWQSSFGFCDSDEEEGKECDLNEDFVFIPSKWLWNWANEVQKPSQIDTFEFRCVHNMLDPARIKQSSKRVTKHFWKAMVAKWGLKDAAPLLDIEFVCLQCVADWCRLYCMEAHYTTDREEGEEEEEEGEEEGQAGGEGDETSQEREQKEVLKTMSQQTTNNLDTGEVPFQENGTSSHITSFPVPITCSGTVSSIENQQPFDDIIVIDQSDNKSMGHKIRVTFDKSHTDYDRRRDYLPCTTQFAEQSHFKNYDKSQQLLQLSECKQDLEIFQMDGSCRNFQQDGCLTNQLEIIDEDEGDVDLNFKADSIAVIDLLDSSECEKNDRLE